MKVISRLQVSSGEKRKSIVHHASIAQGPLTPLNFDEFVPWMCLQFQSSKIVAITRIYREDYVKASVRRASTKSVKSVKTKLTESLEIIQPKESAIISASVDDETVQIKAYYNFNRHLLEVSIVGCPFDINRTIIQVLCIAVPYHSSLSKFTIRKGGLTAAILIELGKILPQSYLTDICFDDTYVPEKNYTVLLQNVSRMKNLSLNRCQLDDETCKEIAASIDIGTPGSTLRTLELSSNQISDVGALALANVLRRNRYLLHLNLSGNLITDKGAIAILNSLMEFPIRYDEILDMKCNRIEFNRKKITIYEQYLKETIVAKERAELQAVGGSRHKSMRPTTGSSKPKSPVSKKIGIKKSQADIIVNRGDIPEIIRKVEYSYPELEQKAKEAVGAFLDPFDADHTLFKGRYYYCVGNMFLCSLNLAYNNLEYSSVQKINAVLEYQSELKKPPGTTGLMRITFEGNSVPKYCDDYVHIEILLKNAINNQLPKAATGATKKKTASPTAGVRKS